MVGFRTDPESYEKNEELKRQTLFKLYDLFDGAFSYQEIEAMDAERIDYLIKSKLEYDSKTPQAREAKKFEKEFGGKKGRR